MLAHGHDFPLGRKVLVVLKKDSRTVEAVQGLLDACLLGYYRSFSCRLHSRTDYVGHRLTSPTQP